MSCCRKNVARLTIEAVILTSEWPVAVNLASSCRTGKLDWNIRESRSLMPWLRSGIQISHFAHAGGRSELGRPRCVFGSGLSVNSRVEL